MRQQDRARAQSHALWQTRQAEARAQSAALLGGPLPADHPLAPLPEGHPNATIDLDPNPPGGRWEALDRRLNGGGVQLQLREGRA